ncbi:PfkB family carbohydrate kinase [Actinotalea solisilvae]|uniref:PfkB family carbohydrate kinase n=1 Tax=Actinotalea solisilvae TaxID=2072922 RepID=UPI0018F26EFB|nr:PfkB family carbohydrate kinase [Actinotalea solisilvae]
MPAARVLAVGLATLDVVQTVDRVPGPDEKVVARGLWVASGGPAANAAVTAAALGVPAALVTRVGAGALARVVTEDLAAHDVDLVDLAAPGASPAVSTVLVTAATGERAVVSVNATRGDGGTGPSTDGRALIAGVGAVLVDGHHLDLALEAAAAARAAGVPVLLDGGSWKAGLERLLALTDVALLSADLRLPGRPDDPPAALLAGVRDLGPALVARSQGGGPVQLLDDDDVVVEVPVPVVTVRDTLGAGDVLHGALAAWLALHGLPAGPAGLRAGLAAAAGAASVSCAADGARGWLADARAVAAARAAIHA